MMEMPIPFSSGCKTKGFGKNHFRRHIKGIMLTVHTTQINSFYRIKAQEVMGLVACVEVRAMRDELMAMGIAG
jgi:hypothetical protein